MDISIKNTCKRIKAKKSIVNKALNRDGSVSIEALFTIPMFIFLILTLIFVLKFVAIDDSFNQSLYETTLEYSMLENSSSDIINSAVFNILLKKNLAEMNMELDAIAVTTSKEDFFQVSAYYTINTPVSKALTFKENIRIYKKTQKIKSYVYITPSGKKYHYEDCILTKGNGVKYDIEDIPDDITPCKNCVLGNNYFEKKK